MSSSGLVGVSDHGGWAILVTAKDDGTLLDRRRVALVEEGLPSIPHHYDGQKLPIDKAVALVERVRASAERQADLALAGLASDVPGARGVALRRCPPLPATVAERIQDARARNVADWVMYRQAIARAAEARGWPVFWYDAKEVQDAASQALGLPDLEPHFQQVRRTYGPPWNQDHKLALAAAIAAAAGHAATVSGPSKGAARARTRRR